MKKEIKDFLITCIPSLVLILLMALCYIFNPRKIFDIGDGIAFIMLAHPFYLIVRELKADEKHFLKGFLKICILLTPYLFPTGTKSNSAIWNVIAVGEYSFTVALWCIAYLYKMPKDKKFYGKRIMLKLSLANILPFVVLNLLLILTSFSEGLSWYFYDIIYTINLVLQGFFGLFGAYYYFKINSMLLGETAKVSVISTTMIVLFAISQYFIYYFAEADKMDFIWFRIKYTYLFLSCAYFAVSTYLRGKADKE